jgi:hypothetical protein
MELKGVTFSTDYAIDAQKVISHNVVGVLPGKTHPTSGSSTPPLGPPGRRPAGRQGRQDL